MAQESNNTFDEGVTNECSLKVGKHQSCNFMVFLSFLFFVSSRSKRDRVVRELPRMKTNQTLRDRGKLKNCNCSCGIKSIKTDQFRADQN